MGEAADFLTTAISVVAKLGLVLRCVVRDLLARMREGAIVTSGTLLALCNAVAQDVPIS
jgi:hypothetical protein